MLPNFIVIGSMKSGTSSLYHYLSDHPEIQASSKKETDFFMTPENFSQGLAWYESLFERENKAMFEASPNYTKRHHFPGVPERIHATLPEVKLVYVLRDPIDRAVSNYVHSVAAGRERKPFTEAIRRPNCPYIENSRYYYQLEAFLEYFPKEQILLVDAAELRKSPQSVLEKIYAFVEVGEHADNKKTQKQRHKSSNKYRPSWFERMLTGLHPSKRWKRKVKSSLKFFRTKIERPEVSLDDRKYLEEIFAEDLRKLREFSGEEFAAWSL